MVTGYCPRCRTITTLHVEMTQCVYPAGRGDDRRLVTRVYHCASCQVFIRNETVEEAGGAAPDSAGTPDRIAAEPCP